MGKRIYPLGRIKYWYAYDADEVCALYAEQSLHPQTVRKWIKNGLSTIDRGRPALIYGYDLKTFLGNMNASGKCKTQIDEMFCFACKDARSPRHKEITITSQHAGIKAKAHCSVCQTAMYKSYKLDDLQELKRKLHVVDVLELDDSATSPVNTHLGALKQSTLNEPLQGELF